MGYLWEKNFNIYVMVNVFDRYKFLFYSYCLEMKRNEEGNV